MNLNKSNYIMELTEPKVIMQFLMIKRLFINPKKI